MSLEDLALNMKCETILQCCEHLVIIPEYSQRDIPDSVMNPNFFFSFQPRLEVMWAMKAYNHAEVYFNVSPPAAPPFTTLIELVMARYSYY